MTPHFTGGYEAQEREGTCPAPQEGWVSERGPGDRTAVRARGRVMPSWGLAPLWPPQMKAGGRSDSQPPRFPEHPHDSVPPPCCSGMTRPFHR